MGNLLAVSKLNNLLLSSILVTFSFTVVIPSPAYAFEIGWREAELAIRLQDLVDKMMKYKDKGDRNF